MTTYKVVQGSPQQLELTKSDKCLDKVGRVLVGTYHACPNASIQKRIVGAIIAKGLTEKHSAELRAEGLLKFSGIEIRRESLVGRGTPLAYYNSLKDFRG